jgi:hypothetical protein
MTDLLRCTGCQSALRMRPEYVGKKLRCPRCKATMSVPATAAQRPTTRYDDPPPLPGDDNLTTEPVPVANTRDAEVEIPKSRRKRRLTEEPEEEVPWVPCPACGAEDPDRVMWTFWGSFYGPALFNHVQCAECGKTYNGRTGRSNFIPALIFVTIPVLLIMGLIGVITWMIMARQFS